MELTDISISIPIVLLILLGLWLLATVDKRILKKIRKEAHRRNIAIEEIRDPKKSDGTSPFGDVFIFTTTTKILGFSGERVIEKVVTSKKEGKIITHWVLIKTVAFIPVSVEWEEIETPYYKNSF